MRIGDTVRLIDVPPGLEDFPDLPTTVSYTHLDVYKRQGLNPHGVYEIEA